MTKVNNQSTSANPVGRFMVAVGGIIVNEDGKILLLQRSSKLDWQPGEWETMYGRLAQFEEPVSGLMREVKEETGLTIQIGNPLTVWHIYRGEENIVENELIGITFLCHTKMSEVVISNEHDSYMWATVEEALGKVTIEGIRRDILAYQKTII